MADRNRDTETDIINAARKVFHAKGYKEATLRDIAAEANLNMAMLHYYFRSKENLFYIIFDEALTTLYNQIFTIVVASETDIFEKIRKIIHEYIFVFERNQHIPKFIIAESMRNPEKIAERMKNNPLRVEAFVVFSQQLKKCADQGLIKPVSPSSLLLSIISLCLFPIVAKPLLDELIDSSIVCIDSVLYERELEIAEFVCSSIKL